MPSRLGNKQAGFGLSLPTRRNTYPNKEIMSGFSVEFDELYFVAAYLYAIKSTKHGPVALVETYVLMFSASLCSSHSNLGLQSAFERDHRRHR